MCTVLSWTMPRREPRVGHELCTARQTDLVEKHALYPSLSLSLSVCFCPCPCVSLCVYTRLHSWSQRMLFRPIKGSSCIFCPLQLQRPNDLCLFFDCMVAIGPWNWLYTSSHLRSVFISCLLMSAADLFITGESLFIRILPRPDNRRGLILFVYLRISDAVLH